MLRLEKDGVRSRLVGQEHVFDAAGEQAGDAEGQWQRRVVLARLQRVDGLTRNLQPQRQLALRQAFAFPQFAPNCSDNVNGVIVDNMWLSSVGELGAIANEKINFKIDGGHGHSGSPVFYCPNDGDDECTGDEKAFVIAVWTGWNGFETTMVGPKGPSFRNTATTTMDNN